MNNIPEKIEKAVLELVQNAGVRLKIDVLMPEPYRDGQGYTVDAEKEGNKAEIMPKNKVWLVLVWPKNGDFSAWADYIVKAEELIDVAENNDFAEKEMELQYSSFVEKIEHGSRNR